MVAISEPTALGPTYYEADLRPVLEALVALRDGNFRTRLDPTTAVGGVAEICAVFNQVMERKQHFADELARVHREVARVGRLDERLAPGPGPGAWASNVQVANALIDSIVLPAMNAAAVIDAVAAGDLSQRADLQVANRPLRGDQRRLGRAVNRMVDQLDLFTGELTRVAREVGTEGRLGGQAKVSGVSGVWEDLTYNVNYMADNLTTQVRNIALVATAVAGGDLTKKIDVDAQGEILQLKTTINTMVDQLSAFAGEVTRVAREVGFEGRLGASANVRGVSGVWRDLTDNVDRMAFNLTAQVRNIAQVTTAVANGDLTKKIDVDAQGEILELKTTINQMVDQLSSFASEVTRVAREVGSEGMLGGQAEVEGVSGTWKRLTENVNLLASNLTTQVRAIAEVASAVTRGDMSQQIAVVASGEVAELKDNVNLMVTNLRETTRAKDWLENNLARIAALMQGHRDLMEVADLILSELTPLVSAQYGAFFLTQDDDEGLVLIAGYGYGGRTSPPTRFAPGEGLIGQATMERRRILIRDAPPDYITIKSGLGEASPSEVVVLPIIFEERVLGVIELASFSPFSDMYLAFFDQFVHTIGVAINTIITNSRTENLLGESQRLTAELQDRSVELQRQQAELRDSNSALEEKAALLAEQNRAIEVQNTEIEQARQALEDRAEQLGISSRYKSEFLANMSHELRTPLNSMLILARLLADNPDLNLTDKQVEFAETIRRAGVDLQQLIDDILDLSKIEAGRMDIHPTELPISEVVEYVEATFRPLATDKSLDFDVEVGAAVPETIFVDEQRLQQILRNLLSNAIKFTADGEVRLRIAASGSLPFTGEGLRHSGDVLAFSISDTGVGIPADKLRVIFEAFQQADGTTSREYGGTGLGLSISQEIARLLDGEIHVASRTGSGSTFTLYLPSRYSGEIHPEEPTSYELTAGESGDTRYEITRALLGGGLEEVFAGRTVMVVDDDVRNVFALTSVLERHGMEVAYAENGRIAIERLQATDGVSLVLMDVMMPEMDGYRTMRAIRAIPRLADLPIVALTAKVMKSDRDRCLDAGASDYLPKPVDVDQLLAVMRKWLER